MPSRTGQWRRVPGAPAAGAPEPGARASSHGAVVIQFRQLDQRWLAEIRPQRDQDRRNFVADAVIFCLPTAGIDGYWRLRRASAATLLRVPPSSALNCEVSLNRNDIRRRDDATPPPGRRYLSARQRC